MSEQASRAARRRKPPKLPPRWFVRVAWRAHRALYRLSGGRLGLWAPRPGRWGAMRLTTMGRLSGRERSVVLAYLQDGEDLVTLAMNGWAPGEPAWWLNLQEHPIALVDLKGGCRTVRARAACGHDRERLWQLWRDLEPDLDDYAAMRDGETAVVVLQPLTTSRA